MLHEILVGLLGIEGNIIRFQQNTVQINRYDFIQPNQQELLKQIMDLGLQYSKIIGFIKADQQDDLQQNKNALPNLYYKGLIRAVSFQLQIYRSEIQLIEEEFLNDRIFNLVSLKYKLNKYYTILPIINSLFEHIVGHNLSGTLVLDHLYSHFQKKDINCEFYQILEKQMVDIFKKQIIDFCVFGIVDSEFFLQKVKQNEQLDQFVMKLSQIPYNLIDIDYASKIQFIANCASILIKNNQHLQQVVPVKQIIEQFSQFDKYNLEVLDIFNNDQTMLDQLKIFFSQEIFIFLNQNIKLLETMAQLKRIFLMNDGEFYQQFIEETKGLMQFPPILQKAEHDLNQVYLPNSIIQLKKTAEHYNNIQMKIKRSGFMFENFHEHQNLIKLGSIQQVNQYLRFQSLNGPNALIYPITQQLDQGFQCAFTFRFKKNQQQAQIISEQHINGFSLLITGLTHQQIQNHHSIESLSEFIQFQFVYDDEKNENKLQINYLPKDSKNLNKKKITLVEKSLAVDFSEEDQHQFKIEYNEHTFTIYLTEEPILQQSLNIERILNLNYGKGSLLLSQFQRNSKFSHDLFDFRFKSYNFFNRQDPWNGLSIEYPVGFPINLLVDKNLLEKYNTFFRFLFPIRKIQIQLQQAWLQTKKDHQHQNQYNQSQKIKFNSEIKVRNQFQFFFDNLWNFFAGDLVSEQWKRLEHNYNNIQDFEQLKKLVDQYAINMQRGFFLHLPQLVRMIFQQVSLANQFLSLIARSDQFQQELDFQLDQIDEKSEQNLREMISVLEMYNRVKNEELICTLLQRLDWQNSL